MVVILVMMQVSKKIPFEDPNVLMAIRIAYVVSNLIIMGVYYYVQVQINKKKGKHYLFLGATLYADKIELGVVWFDG